VPLCTSLAGSTGGGASAPRGLAGHPRRRARPLLARRSQTFRGGPRVIQDARNTHSWGRKARSLDRWIGIGNWSSRSQSRGRAAGWQSTGASWRGQTRRHGDRDDGCLPSVRWTNEASRRRQVTAFREKSRLCAGHGFHQQSSIEEEVARLACGGLSHPTMLRVTSAAGILSASRRRGGRPWRVLRANSRLPHCCRMTILAQLAADDVLHRAYECLSRRRRDYSAKDG
jgi:hypothetical protein